MRYNLKFIPEIASLSQVTLSLAYIRDVKLCTQHSDHSRIFVFPAKALFIRVHSTYDLRYTCSKFPESISRYQIAAIRVHNM